MITITEVQLIKLLISRLQLCFHANLQCKIGNLLRGRRKHGGGHVSSSDSVVAWHLTVPTAPQIVQCKPMNRGSPFEGLGFKQSEKSSLTFILSTRSDSLIEMGGP